MRVRTIIRTLLRKPTIWFCDLWTTDSSISLMRRCNHIQLSVPELKKIISTIKSKPGCKLLVFGVGNDSLLWTYLNKNGHTTFLEDNQQWLETVKTRDKITDIHLVDYATQCSQWKELLSSPQRLGMSLPEDLQQPWNIILVDAPAGWYDTAPGRMKSIYQSSLYIRPAVDIFVHDCDREIERKYCDEYLKPQRMVEQIEKLRHYHF